jgi:hypothetical protein
MSAPSVGAAAACLSVLALAGACQPQTTCEMDGTACGGDPTGTWTVFDGCRDPAFAAPLPPTYQGQPVEMARVPNPVMASSDWCSALFVSSGTTAFNFPHDTLAIAGGQITYGSDGTYQAVVNTGGPGAIDLSAACLTRSGMNLTCDAVAAAMADVAASKPAPPGLPCSDSLADRAECRYYFTYSDIACAGDGAGGCRCAYRVAFAGAFAGQWGVSGGVLTHFDAAKLLPTQADYCVDAAQGTLALWGHDRTWLFDQPGIRTLKLRRGP